MIKATVACLAKGFRCHRPGSVVALLAWTALAAPCEPTAAAAPPSPLFAEPESERSWRVLARYRKASVDLYQTSGKSSDHSLVFQPSVDPIAGIGVDFSANLGVEVDASIPFLHATPAGVGSTQTRVFDFHYLQDHWGVDLYAHQYRSLFRDDVGRHDLRPFRDALFGNVQSAAAFPSMDLRGVGLDGVYTLWPESFSNLAAMSRSVLPLRDGWSPIGVASLRYTSLTNDGPILPAAFTGDPRVDGVAGYHAWSAAALPGLAGMLVSGPWCASAIAAYGYGYQHSELEAADPGDPDHAVAELFAQASVAYSAASSFYGLAGYYTNLASQSRALGTAESLSSVELFYGQRF